MNYFGVKLINPHLNLWRRGNVKWTFLLEKTGTRRLLAFTEKKTRN